MIGIADNSKGAFVPASNAEANGEIMGRANALHDWLMAKAKERSTYEHLPEPLYGDLLTVAVLMGYTDVLAVKMKPKKEETN